MFTDCNIKERKQLTDIVKTLVDTKEFSALKDNGVSIGIFAFQSNKQESRGGTIQIATELEKKHGYDVVIYMDDTWLTYSSHADVESYIYQMLLSVTPDIVGKNNDRVIFLDKNRGIIIYPETVKKYGKDIQWYKDIFK